MPERARAVRAPLSVVLTRPAGQSAPLAAALARLAPSRIETVAFPLIEIRASAAPHALDEALHALARFALVFFVSPNAIDQAFARGAALGIDVAAALRRNRDAGRTQDQGVLIAAVGPGSVQALAAHGVRPGTHRLLAPAGALEAAGMPGGHDPADPASARRPSRDDVAALRAPDAPDLRETFDAPSDAVPGARSDAVPGTRSDAVPGAPSDALSDVPPETAFDALPDAAPGAMSDHARAQRRQAQAEAIRYDSEALLDALARSGARPGLAGRDALIVRGDGGRELFADALRDAGMTVQAVTAYERHVPAPDAAAWRPIERLLDDALPHVWILTSSEGVRNLETLARAHFAPGDDRHAALRRARVIVPHPRIAAAANRAGFDTITNAGAGDANLLRAILAVSDLIAHDEHDRP
ncbi:MAG: uroporphyrinogen-III synthase [Janthinobacterium lividum]